MKDPSWRTLSPLIQIVSNQAIEQRERSPIIQQLRNSDAQQNFHNQQHAISTLKGKASDPTFRVSVRTDLAR